MNDGTVFHFIYRETKENKDAWTALPQYMDQALLHINKLYGKYPYKQYTIAQGGDGGMEYPMLTLITGNRPLRSLVGVSVHELMHMWYQMVLGSNEVLYAWMDEGFTSYASSEIMARIFPTEDNNAIQRGNYLGYFGLVASGVEEPLSTHADHFMSNFAYGAAAYNKGAVFLNQLGYILGKEALDLVLLDYYAQWQFKHPTARDFIRVAEKRSGIELDWYYEYWVNSIKTIDYGIDSAWVQQGNLHISLSQRGTMPMPIDVAILDNSGNALRVHIPLDLMRGFKRKDTFFALDYVAPDWPWTSKTYTLLIPGPWPEGTTTIAIDPGRRMADINTSNNVFKVDIGGS
jgi:aminopeptidase N